MKIIVDAFGGDFAPNEILKACTLAKKENPTLKIYLSGNKEKILKAAKNLNIDISNFYILNAKDIISAEEEPTKILKEKNESSLAVGLKTLNNSDMDAFITAGSTAALAVGSYYISEKIKGIKRAAFCTILPCKNGKSLLLDAGANLECKENILYQFAIMGNIYAKKIFKIKNPRIGLANVGVEAKKGTAYHKAAYELLLKDKNINFIGNIEARYVHSGICDVIVCDGLSGNMIIKTMEGTAKFLIEMLKKIYMSSIKSKLAAMLLKKEHKMLKKNMDYTNYGGAIYIGFKKPIIKAHGNSNAKTFKNAIYNAISYTKENVTNEIENILHLKEDVKEPTLKI